MGIDPRDRRRTPRWLGIALTVAIVVPVAAAAVTGSQRWWPWQPYLPRMSDVSDATQGFLLGLPIYEADFWYAPFGALLGLPLTSAGPFVAALILTAGTAATYARLARYAGVRGWLIGLAAALAIGATGIVHALSQGSLVPLLVGLLALELVALLVGPPGRDTGFFTGLVTALFPPAVLVIVALALLRWVKPALLAAGVAVVGHGAAAVLLPGATVDYWTRVLPGMVVFNTDNPTTPQSAIAIFADAAHQTSPMMVWLTVLAMAAVALVLALLFASSAPWLAAGLLVLPLVLLLPWPFGGAAGLPLLVGAVVTRQRTATVAGLGPVGRLAALVIGGAAVVQPWQARIDPFAATPHWLVRHELWATAVTVAGIVVLFVVLGVELLIGAGTPYRRSIWTPYRRWVSRIGFALLPVGVLVWCAWIAHEHGFSGVTDPYVEQLRLAWSGGDVYAEPTVPVLMPFGVLVAGVAARIGGLVALLVLTGLALAHLAHRAGLRGWRAGVAASGVLVLISSLWPGLVGLNEPPALAPLLVLVVLLDLAPGDGLWRRWLPLSKLGGRWDRERVVPEGIGTGLVAAMSPLTLVVVALLLLTGRHRAGWTALITFGGATLLGLVAAPGATASLWSGLMAGTLPMAPDSLAGWLAQMTGHPGHPLVVVGPVLAVALSFLAALRWHRGGARGAQQQWVALGLVGVGVVLAESAPGTGGHLWLLPILAAAGGTGVRMAPRTAARVPTAIVLPAGLALLWLALPATRIVRPEGWDAWPALASVLVVVAALVFGSRGHTPPRLGEELQEASSVREPVVAQPDPTVRAARAPEPTQDPEPTVVPQRALGTVPESEGVATGGDPEATGGSAETSEPKPRRQRSPWAQPEHQDMPRPRRALPPE
ncbi:glycosyltransferase 87 family protein [Parenemella sanctibonifatiensis]|uniref:DUF2029 domain-containing protein n=1 Tax=Parenemella sanctibonifatiensis TaxID=2016505 RepID=A0A255EGK5_9ACTN|nr:glycosyltransferase 87 family protein [Parenemella sanctibonifatiensis]OYN88735.1 hypothetical protein CGZ92_03225 [Parenemella sanctibonifatiensis]